MSHQPGGTGGGRYGISFAGSGQHHEWTRCPICDHVEHYTVDMLGYVFVVCGCGAHSLGLRPAPVRKVRARMSFVPVGEDAT